MIECEPSRTGVIATGDLTAAEKTFTSKIEFGFPRLIAGPPMSVRRVRAGKLKHRARRKVLCGRLRPVNNMAVVLIGGARASSGKAVRGNEEGGEKSRSAALL